MYFEVITIVIPFLCRYGCFTEFLEKIEKNEKGGLESYSTSYREFGIHGLPDGSVTCKEWCPGAKELFLWGDFSMFALFLIT